MKRFCFDLTAGHRIDQFGSTNFVLTSIVQVSAGARIRCAYLAPNGLVGYHQTTTDQLFLVVQGAGWVRGHSPERLSISANQAAFWEKGEWHESGTDSGMTAIIIEGDDLDPARFMPALDQLPP